ncbi:MAG: sulfatase-like hydrolase/transferase [Vicingaceae bacterium]
MKTIKTSFFLYMGLLLLFGALRLLLLASNANLTEDFEINDILWSFLIGLRFDLVVAGYLLLLPVLTMGLVEILPLDAGWISKWLFRYLLIFPGISLMIATFNIPYFNQFFTHINSGIFLYNDEFDFLFNMIRGEITYWIYLPVSVLAVFVWYKWLKKSLGLFSDKGPKLSRLLVVTLPLFALILTLLAIRGRIEGKSPIRTGTAFFSNHAFLNKLGLNANYTLVTSSLFDIRSGSKVHQFYTHDQALSAVKKSLKLAPDLPTFNRLIECATDPSHANVVLVIMESMSAAKMGYFGNTEELTPHLDSLSESGMAFTQMYTAGIHTYNGIFSSLFGLPILYNYHPLKQAFDKKFHGLPGVLKDQGYQNWFFSTHDAQFDNMDGFLRNNGMHRIVSIDDYHDKKKLSTLGIGDDVMFEQGLSFLTEDGHEKPFLAVFLTASDHGPYVIPEYYHPKASSKKKQAVQYADWSIGKLMKLARKHPWFDNTYFVFIADHGSWDYAVYQMPLTYHHSPFIIYSPALMQPTVKEDLASQMDVFPTILGLLNVTYENHSLGIDLLKEKRDYVYFSNDENIGILDQQYFLVMDKKNNKLLLEYKKKSHEDLSLDKIEKVREMERFAKAHFQVGMGYIRELH